MSDRMESYNELFRGAEPASIMRWLIEETPGSVVMSTSFGIYSSAFLHFVTQFIPDIPVLWVDTGYLPPETYVFAETLEARFDLNLRIYQSEMSPARMEALHGKIWESDNVEQMNKYDFVRKVAPMQRALKDQQAEFWLAGLRRGQTDVRNRMNLFNEQDGVIKILPILEWSTNDVLAYVRKHDLPLHPLHEKGYATVGDSHSSRPMSAEDNHERETRFRGKKQECGLHLELSEAQLKSLDSSSL